jgi:hypothetical protein
VKETPLPPERPADNATSALRSADTLDKRSDNVSPTSQSRRVHSINFDPQISEWLEATVQLLRQAGLPKAGRSEIVRVALSELQRALSEHTPADAVKFFLDRDVEWRLSRLQPPKADDQK